MLNLVKQFIQDEEGATAIEYGLLLALMAAAITVAVGVLGDGLKTSFQGIVDQLNTATTTSTTPTS